MSGIKLGLAIHRANSFFSVPSLSTPLPEGSHQTMDLSTPCLTVEAGLTHSPARHPAADSARAGLGGRAGAPRQDADGSPHSLPCAASRHLHAQHGTHSGAGHGHILSCPCATLACLSKLPLAPALTGAQEKDIVGVVQAGHAVHSHPLVAGV